MGPGSAPVRAFVVLPITPRYLRILPIGKLREVYEILVLAWPTDWVAPSKQRIDSTTNPPRSRAVLVKSRNRRRKSGNRDDDLNFTINPTCLWQAPASAQKTKKKNTRPGIRRSARWPGGGRLQCEVQKEASASIGGGQPTKRNETFFS